MDQFLFPFSMFKTPLSGDVIQNISPEVTGIEIAGDAELERKIVQNVASYGKQLGLILKALEALVPQDERKTDAFKALFDMADDVKQATATHRNRLDEDAREALERLKQSDAAAYDTLVQSLQAEATSR